jgi:hypothetical protein
VCFSWRDKGECLRVGCPFEHPDNPPPDSPVWSHKEASGKRASVPQSQGAANGMWGVEAESELSSWGLCKNATHGPHCEHSAQTQEHKHERKGGGQGPN